MSDNRDGQQNIVANKMARSLSNVNNITINRVEFTIKIVAYTINI